jgi:hypothetical protein
MAKLTSIANAHDLEQALKKVPKDEFEGELRFRAIRGKRAKGFGFSVDEDNGKEYVGLFIGTQMLHAFDKERRTFAKPVLYDGTIRRSEHRPTSRLVLVSRGSGAALRTLARECIQQAKLNYKIVTLKPGETEPRDDQDDPKVLVSGGSIVTLKPGETKPRDYQEDDPKAKDPITMPENPSYLSYVAKDIQEALLKAFPTEELNKIEEALSRTSSDKNFDLVLSLLKQAQAQPTKANLLDLKSATLKYLVHVMMKYSEPLSEISSFDKLRVTTAERVRSQLEELKIQDYAEPDPSPPTVKDLKEVKLKGATGMDWRKKFKEVCTLLKNLQQRLAPEIFKRLKDQLILAQYWGMRKDHYQAHLLLNLLEIELARKQEQQAIETKEPSAIERFLKAFGAAQKMLKKLAQFVSDKRLAPVVSLLKKAEELGKAQKFDEALELLDRIPGMEKSIVSFEIWAKKINLSECKCLKQLGKGGCGAIYKLDHPNGVDLILKIAHSLDPKLQEGARKALVNEAEMYEKIGCHPNIARCLGIQKVDNEEGLVLEAIRGGTVEDQLDEVSLSLNKGKIKLSEYLGVMQYALVGTLQALAHMADLGYAHLDIKPPNIMYDETGEVKLVDLGIAAVSGQGGDNGTLGYKAPETVGGKGGTASDVFGVGALAFLFGEQKSFKYNAPEYYFGSDIDPYVTKYGSGENRALHKGDNKSVSVEEDTKTGKRTKQPGGYVAETEYVRFVNWLLHPDPEKRPTAREALNHPFLKDRLLSDEEAKKIIGRPSNSY